MPETEQSIGMFIISPIPPVVSGKDWDNFVWLDTVDRKAKRFIDSIWTTVIDFSDTTKGYTGKQIVGKSTWIFENGLLTSIVTTGPTPIPISE
jgi:hypothetical protein